MILVSIVYKGSICSLDLFFFSFLFPLSSLKAVGCMSDLIKHLFWYYS